MRLQRELAGLGLEGRQERLEERPGATSRSAQMGSALSSWLCVFLPGSWSYLDVFGAFSSESAAATCRNITVFHQLLRCSGQVT